MDYSISKKIQIRDIMSQKFIFLYFCFLRKKVSKRINEECLCFMMKKNKHGLVQRWLSLAEKVTLNKLMKHKINERDLKN